MIRKLLPQRCEIDVCHILVVYSRGRYSHSELVVVLVRDLQVHQGQGQGVEEEPGGLDVCSAWEHHTGPVVKVAGRLVAVRALSTRLEDRYEHHVWSSRELGRRGGSVRTSGVVSLHSLGHAELGAFLALPKEVQS